jgi:hypothetical protein
MHGIAPDDRRIVCAHVAVISHVQSTARADSSVIVII